MRDFEGWSNHTKKHQQGKIPCRHIFWPSMNPSKEIYVFLLSLIPLHVPQDIKSQQIFKNSLVFLSYSSLPIYLRLYL